MWSWKQIRRWLSKEWKLHPALAKGLISLGAVMVLFLVVVVAYLAAYWKTILPGVEVANQPVGNLTGEQAAEMIETTTMVNKPVIQVVFDGQSETVSWEQLGGEVLVSETVNQAWQVGRKGSWLERIGEAQRSFFEGEGLGLEIEVSEEKLSEWLKKIETGIEQEAIEPSLIKDGEELSLEPGQLGRELEKEKLEKQVREAFAYWQSKEIRAPVKVVGESLDKKMGEKAVKVGKKLLGKELRLKYDGSRWDIKEEELLSWVNVNQGGGFDTERVEESAAGLAESINREPQNAVFRFEDGEVEEFKPAYEGWQVKEKELVEEIVDSWDEVLNKEEVVEIVVSIKKTQAEITTSEVNNLGIEELVGKGESTYFHSIPNRVHNVGLAASRVSGALVKPGEVFSLVNNLGEISGATGFKSAYVISNGRTRLGDGGGVCQVSTTLFRAVLQAGLPIVERHAHSYRVSYYEQNSLPGVDATVMVPRVDLKFENNTPVHLLIQAVIDESNRYLAFEIYGKDDGRQVEISKPKVWGETPPPPPLYEDDPTLPEGQVKQIDWAAWGAKTSFDYRVTSSGGEVLEDRTFYSNYRPWQAVYLRGVKE